MGLFSSIFGGGGSSQDVDLIDPNQVIGQQAQVNRVNQMTPFGSLTYGGPNSSNLNYNLSPELQALYQTQTEFGRSSGQMGQNILNQNAAGGAYGQVAPQNVDAITGALFDLGYSRGQPVFDQRRSRLQESLTQSGNPGVGADLAPGAVSELDVLGQQENQWLSDLAMQSVLYGPQVQGQLLGNDINALNANLQAPLSLGNASPIGIPQYNFQGPQPIDVLGGYQLNQSGQQFNAGQAQKNQSGLLGGLFDLGAAGITGYYS